MTKYRKKPVDKQDVRGSSRGSYAMAENEEALTNFEFNFTPTYHRNAVSVTNEENEKPVFVDCKTPQDVKGAIKDILEQYSIMQGSNDYELTYESLIEAIEWFLDPERSEGRKID